MVQEPKQRWQENGKAQAYASTRWSTTRREQRDPRLVQRLLRKLGSKAPAPGARVLDLPTGTGRLIPSLRSSGFRVVCADVSPSMLAAHRAPQAPCLLADANRLPFANKSFDLVVCCRLLHHLRDEVVLGQIVGELIRVSRGPVIASFWDATCLPEKFRRVGKFTRSKPPRPRGRLARGRTTISRIFESHGAPVFAYAASMRYISRQTFLVALPGSET